jgi:hypothetical protein
LTGDGFTPEWLQQRLRENPHLSIQGSTQAYVCAGPQGATKGPAFMPQNILSSGRNEAEFQAEVIKQLHDAGWLVAHFRPGLTRSGQWVTAVAGDGVGWPDLACARPPDFFIAELKGLKGKLSLGQERWISTLRNSGIPTFIWTPADWNTIEQIIKGGLKNNA